MLWSDCLRVFVRSNYICNVRKSIQIPAAGIPLSILTSSFRSVALLQSNYSNGRNLLALGIREELVIDYDQNSHGKAWQQLSAFRERVSNKWVFGYLSYELKDSLPGNLVSENSNLLDLSLMRFFCPEIVLEWMDGQSVAQVHFVQNSRTEHLLGELARLLSSQTNESELPVINFEQNVTEPEYIARVENIKSHIQRGDIYELNYCIPFDARVEKLATAKLFNRLNERTSAPFSVYYSDSNHVLMCGSPERFLQKRGNILRAQPIKGTIRRGSGSGDDALIEQLRNDPKERAENVMITDLVRNDLSRVAAPQSVKVDELCGIYTFKTVHQMISTITAQLADDKTAVDALEATFPMGSMTGAPKIRAMQIIEENEIRRRGLYSGSFGYFEPNGDFDFNVVIRSMIYNKLNSQLSFEVGSAITSLSDPKKEYEECLLKAEALLQAAQSTTHAV